MWQLRHSVIDGGSRLTSGSGSTGGVFCLSHSWDRYSSVYISLFLLQKRVLPFLPFLVLEGS